MAGGAGDSAGFQAAQERSPVTRSGEELLRPKGPEYSVSQPPEPRVPPQWDNGLVWGGTKHEGSGGFLVVSRGVWPNQMLADNIAVIVL